MLANYLETYQNALPPGARVCASRARKFLDWLGDREPNAEAVRKYMEKLAKEGYEDGTRRAEWGVLRRLYILNHLEWPFRRGDAPLIREEHVFAPALATDDIKAMVDVALGRAQPLGGVTLDSRHRAYLALSTIWGLRLEEMYEMQPSFLDVDSGLLFVQTAKAGRQRWHIVPPLVMPHLLEWGFQSPMSKTGITKLFTGLKASIGLKIYDIGWYSIRRALVKALWNAHFPETTINHFQRWKRSTSNMALRYGMSRTVGRETEAMELAPVDRDIDEAILAQHPFLKFWEG